MRTTEKTLMGLALAVLLASPSFAGGTAHRSPSMRQATRRGRTQPGTPNRVKFNRLRNNSDYMGGRGYRRSPSRPYGRQGGYSQRGMLRRAGGEYIGYNARDSLVMGAGRYNRDRYDSGRDRVIAGNRGRRVVNTGRRVGNAFRRIFTP